VDIAANGMAALGKVEAQDYDVIMSDIKMPELDGPGLYRAVEQRHPRLLRRFVFVTGDTLGGETEGFLEQTGAPTLGKPFSLDEIRHAVQRVLGVQ
jgi:CheY-like chemotaxis protein